MEIPDFITHYNRSEPFRSLSSVAPEKVPAVLKELNEENAWGLSRFSDPEYLQRRLKVEQKMRLQFIAKGGKPVLEHPIYFFLGKNTQFEERPKNKGYVIQIEELTKHTVSFTYGDSMFSHNEDYRLLMGEGYLSDLCAQTFTHEELPVVYSHVDYRSDGRLHIEAQLWVMPGNFK